MSTGRHTQVKTGEYSLTYTDLCGVDFSGDGSGISAHRLSYSENMYRDYEADGGIIESIPGYRRIIDLGATINGIYSYRTKSGVRMIAAHAGGTVYDFPISNFDTVPTVRSTYGLENKRSAAYSFSDSLYILDGKSITKLSESYNGKVNENGGGIYVPTVYLNGEAYEQSNLLSELVYEKTVIGSVESVSYGTEGLTYAIIDPEKHLCSVTGLESESFDGKLYIPSRKKIGDTVYDVKRIEPRAFYQNKNITECLIASGVSEIGDFAFAYTTNLEKMITPDTVTRIGIGCMTECTSLFHLHLGRALSDIGDSAFSLCTNLNTVFFAGSTLDYMKIASNTELNGKEIVYDVKHAEIVLGIEIYSPCKSLLSVTLDGNIVPYTIIYDGDICKRLRITVSDRAYAEGKTLLFEGRLSSNAEHHTGKTGFLSSSFYHGKDRMSVITGCRKAACFDGRIFVTDNPEYPGVCFYTAADGNGESNPLYFGDMNYFRDGMGHAGNISMLASGDSLLVFKEDDDGGGSIYYHTPHDTGIDILPKIYPVSYIHSGFSAVGESISFFDDPVFISDKGISGIGKKTINLERSIETRSEKINPKLLTESPGDIRLAVWRGYLVCAVGNRIYLGDSRSMYQDKTGNIQYEWFYLCGIGSYSQDVNVYRYASTSSAKDLLLHEKTDERAEGEIMSIMNGNTKIYYVEENGKKYEVYKTEELTGGIISPISAVLSTEGLLLFGTEAGVISVFNSDKRGTPPPTSSIPAEEFQELYGRMIHPYYYSFAGHAPRYAIQTLKDNAGIPHMRKDTVKYSLAVKCRSISGGKIVCEVGTDGEGYREICAFPNRDLFFGDLDFTSMTMVTEDNVTVPIHEKTKGWIEKQILIYTDEFGSPFGIYSISYRFKVKGRIKKSK